MSSDFIPTKSSRQKNISQESYEHVKFSYRTTTEQCASAVHYKSDKRDSNSMDMKKLRYEVIKFGSSGFSESAKEASSVALAVALGAKPPKRKYENYSELLSAKRKEKESSLHIPQSLKTQKQQFQHSKRHFFVVGNKVVPAKPTVKDGSCKKFLEGYGKVNKFKRQMKGGRKNRK